ncbi:hypothetical protein BpHYR1_009164 [Brachionus plicatilis]|uniref:Uncharacterized protein n=1 Tax=Brachionus plicatilis TaxID=10195 RepID=A0A3M7PFK0_BRAPC|nr:hypothetical protein BpHYR1_009164 [Brachionus plicatilis]
MAIVTCSNLDASSSLNFVKETSECCTKRLRPLLLHLLIVLSLGVFSEFTGRSGVGRSSGVESF